MTGRANTLVCTFDPASPRITAWDIHEWIHGTLQLPEQEVLLVQIDGLRRQVYIKLTSNEQMISIIQRTSGSVEYKYTSGEIFRVTIDVAGLGAKRIRIANLPPEVPDDVIKNTLNQYGKVMDIQTEMWSTAYRYQVSNGIRNAHMILAKHIPPNLTLAGHKVLMSYDGQPFTCYTCGDEGHVASACPQKKRPAAERRRTHPASYAGVLTPTDPTAQQRAEGNPTSEPQHNISITNKVDGADSHLTMGTNGPADVQEAPPRENTQTQLQVDAPRRPPPLGPRTNPDPRHKAADWMDSDTWRMASMDSPHEEHRPAVLPEHTQEPLMQTSLQSEQQDHEDPTAETSMEITSLEEDPSRMPEKDTSPKRNKKLRTEKSMANTHDRSRSGTRRAHSKGKTH